MSSGHLRSAIEMRAEAIFLLPVLSGLLWYVTFEQTFLIATMLISFVSVYLHGILIKFQGSSENELNIGMREVFPYLPESRIMVCLVSLLVISYPFSLIWIEYESFMLLNQGVRNIYLFSASGLLFLWVLKLLIPVSESEELPSWKSDVVDMVDHDDGIFTGFQEISNRENTDE